MENERRIHQNLPIRLMGMLSSFNGDHLWLSCKKMAGNFPAQDGPGSYDQPKYN